MDLQIKALVLWPRDAALPPRVLPFERGVVNVISGLSKTGKSAIIPIIDYCLGSEKCAIPVNTIRNACSWFGVVLYVGKGEMLLARREPGGQKATGDMFMLRDKEVQIPESIQALNTNVDAVKSMMDEMSGLTKLNFDPEGSGAGFLRRPGFRDMVSFVFQPQNVVANPNVLFYKADTTEHREKLKTILPYVVGALSPEALALEHERQRLRSVVLRKERELASVSAVSLRWVAEIEAKASRAFELGLLASRPQPGAPVSSLLELLRDASAPSYDSAGRALDVTSVALTDAASELLALEREEAATSTRLSRLKARYADMTRFSESATRLHGSLMVRRERLQVSDWIGTLFEGSHSCPMCGTAGVPVEGEVAALRASLREVEGQAAHVAQLPAAFDREYERVKQDLDLEVERVNAVRVRRRTLQESSSEARDRQYQLSEVTRFAGGLAESLAQYDRLADDGELSTEVALLRERLATIEWRLRELDTRSAIGRASKRLSALMAHIIPELDTERDKDPVELLFDELTLKVTGQGREDYLWEIGSGANWLAYHITAIVALHQLFAELKPNHVPTFAVFDQPSQVYFPRLDGGADDVSPERVPVRLRDQDVIQVRKVFQVLAAMTIASRGKWQAIVLDHAGPEIWEGISGVSLAADWHDGGKLVPPEWLVQPGTESTP
jgi:hypothetical protein